MRSGRCGRSSAADRTGQFIEQSDGTKQEREREMGIRRLAAAALLAILVAGCAGVPTRKLPPTPDRFERMNRGIDKFNRGVDRYTLRPIAVGYKKVVPHPLRIAISNFFDNLEEPINIVNNLLQGKFARGGSEVGRFLLNSTVGIGGLIDVATHAGLEAHEEDFGQTLAVWGLGSGPYLVVPFLGPYTLRDGFGDVLDSPMYPVYWIEEDKVRYAFIAVWAIDTRSQFLDIDRALNEALDPYVFLRESFLQHRTYEIYDGDPPLEDFPEDELPDESAPPPGQ
jgi:phospholipid-binding lipoprotein MlaA